MNKSYIIILIFLAFVLLSFQVFAGDKDEDVPVGMEIIKIGDARVLVPKGTQIYKQGDMNVVEDISEYSSRKFVEIEGRFEKLESDIKSIKRDIEEMKEMIEDKK